MKVNLIPPAHITLKIIGKISASHLLCRIAVTVCACQLVSCGSIGSLLRNSPAVSNRSTQHTAFEQGAADGTDQSLNGSGDAGDTDTNSAKSPDVNDLGVCRLPAKAEIYKSASSEFTALALPICSPAPLIAVTKAGAVVWWDPIDETPYKIFDLKAPPKIAALSSHGLLAAQSASGAVQVFDVSSGAKLYTLPANAIRGRLSAISFTDNSEALLLSELSGRVLKIALTNENLQRARPIVEGYSPRAAVLTSVGRSASGAVFCSTWDGDIFAFKTLSHLKIASEPSYSVTVNGVTQAKDGQVSAGRKGAPFISLSATDDGELLVGVTERGDVELWSVRGLLKRSELLNETGGRPSVIAAGPGVIGILERDGVVRLIAFNEQNPTAPVKEFFRQQIGGAQMMVLGDNGVGYLALTNGKVLQLNYGRIIKKASN